MNRKEFNEFIQAHLDLAKDMVKDAEARLSAGTEKLTRALHGLINAIAAQLKNEWLDRVKASQQGKGEHPGPFEAAKVPNHVYRYLVERALVETRLPEAEAKKDGAEYAKRVVLGGEKTVNDTDVVGLKEETL